MCEILYDIQKDTACRCTQSTAEKVNTYLLFITRTYIFGYRPQISVVCFLIFSEHFISKQIQKRFEHKYKHNSLRCFQKFCYRCCRQSADHEDLALGIAWFDPPVYLDRARIFRRFRFSLRIRFLRHFALMFSRALKYKFQSVSLWYM